MVSFTCDSDASGEGQWRRFPSTSEESPVLLPLKRTLDPSAVVTFTCARKLLPPPAVPNTRPVESDDVIKLERTDVSTSGRGSLLPTVAPPHHGP